VFVCFAGDMARGCGGKQGCFGPLGTAHPLASDCLTGKFIGQETARTQCQCECTYIAVPVLLQLCRTLRLHCIYDMMSRNTSVCGPISSCSIARTIREDVTSSSHENEWPGHHINGAEIVWQHLEAMALIRMCHRPGSALKEQISYNHSASIASTGQLCRIIEHYEYRLLQRKRTSHYQMYSKSNHEPSVAISFPE
jgi:hypothetical protein